ncbi:MAG: indolepyruvate ferredoxin oxidoreductase subunit alpha [Clostridia bacterium]|jgi:indolepyruvate ferredoxin oxidoreductase alpha subunit
MKQLLLANEAVARGLYEAGVTVVSSYPGTPSTEITETASKYEEIYTEWAPNEKVALEVAATSAIAGARSFCAMKHVGLNVAADPLFTMSYIGVNAGFVIAVADDPGMHSSQNEQDSRYYAQASKILMLEPSDSQEAKDFTKKAYELSEEFDTPVILRLSTRVSHSQSLTSLEDRVNVPLREYIKNPQKNVMMPAMARVKHGLVEQRIAKQKEYAFGSDLNQMSIKNSKIGFISSGIAFQYALEALPDASYLKLGIVYPISEELLKKFAASVEFIYVIEELEPIIENACLACGIKVVGKELLPVTGEYSVELIRNRIFGDKPFSYMDGYDMAKIPKRPPVMCPGCPHRGLFHVLKKLKLTVTGDIGCYTLGALEPLSSMDTSICMGSGVSSLHGFNKARGDDYMKKCVGVIGDSTFIHSGITGLIDIVYNKGVGTVIILDNSITGMTGHQNNPLNGLDISNNPAKKIDLALLAKSIGIDRVRIIDPFNIEDSTNVIREEVNAMEPSLIIARRPCALLKTVKYKGLVEVNRDKCTKCRACMSIGCPAISFKNNQIEINASLCNGCGLCINVCKFGALNKKEEE